jgi:hypothetical protein
MKGIWERINELSGSLRQRTGKALKRLGRLFSFAREPALPVVRDSRKRPIINPKVTSPPPQVIRPTRYLITRAEALSAVLRKHDYINVRPPRVHSATGGER